MVSRNTPMSACGDDDTSAEPIFEMVVLGSGGGPLETDSSGYLLKPYKSSWEDGIVAIEGGSGLGALTDLIERQGLSQLFPTLNMPETHNSPILQAGYIFSLLSCYLITHAHLDHCLSLILMSGSIPPRPPVTTSVKSRDSNGAPLSPPPTSRIPKRPPPPPAMPQPPVYATRKTLERLSKAYGGEIWPELGTWASESSGKPLAAGGSIAAPDDSSSRKRRKTEVQDPPPIERRHSVAESDSDHMGTCGGCGVIFAPLQPAKVHRPLHSGLPITTLKFHVSHGCTSKGTYESSAMFIRYDPEAVGGTPSGSASAGPSEPSVPRRGSRSSSRLAQAESSSAVSETSASGRREFLFFGDVESDFRLPGEEGHDVEGRDRAREYNQAIWEEAARSWDQGRLAGIFIECSYDSARPAHLMFGHISPPGMLYELKKLAAGVKRVDGKPPLDGLRIFVTHIKESLVPHPSGKTSRERIMTELRDLESSENTGGLGVRFVEVKRGDRILI